MNCAILGAGSRGTALAQILASNGNKALLWTISQVDAENINQKRENTAYLPGVLLDTKISCSLSLEGVVKEAEMIVLALPSATLRCCLQQLKPYYKGQTLILASKGWEGSDFSPLSSLITQILGECPFVVLSGASHAEEVVRSTPTGVVLASQDLSLALQIQSVFQNEWFKCEISNDILGVQLMGAFKNIIALACGIVDGLGHGANTKALLLTKGLQETITIGTLLGADSETFKSFAGIGDLYVTCSSSLSRNWNAGRLLAHGHSKEHIIGELMNMVAESLYMGDTIEHFLDKEAYSFPLLEMIVAIVNQKVPASQAFTDFLKKC